MAVSSLQGQIDADVSGVDLFYDTVTGSAVSASAARPLLDGNGDKTYTATGATVLTVTGEVVGIFSDEFTNPDGIDSDIETLGSDPQFRTRIADIMPRESALVYDSRSFVVDEARETGYGEVIHILRETTAT